MAQEPQNQADQNAAPIFSIEKLYVHDASIEVPNAPAIFTERTTPQINVELGNTAQQVEDGIFNVSIKVTVTAKIEDKTAFLVEVNQSGIFAIRNVPQENMEPILAVACPNILFPYAREAISDMVTRAGFMPVLLNPINFEALYLQQQQQAAQAAGAPN
ncbi:MULTISPECIES: protein-export chaperone SecB [unclassified Methylophilus]|jgi:preprotein translocase subunit SecB|uniref:Protein-export protein SecB n=1 Tax=Methylophilus glucosoxydans TaxID=752553 RepID=A0ABW3GGN3_9PROT|nr:MULTISPECIES: protein-export chaperone SecB [unclassified Methylophilus]MBF5039469.1 protein-export chaperone SecB [Methylophilus sp. 13]MDF0377607.1 protein-export chaperone SecB [Methylophilus sp. YYY-1]MDT7849858.1 protein-export chaperone SecB [Methylophilus sp. VKM B-3414]BEV08891.1 protein-export chaperone SecB [Methylophilus sp. DW102]